MKRRWRVVLLRAKGEILGTVKAPDAEAAKAAAAVQFELDAEGFEPPTPRFEVWCSIQRHCRIPPYLVDALRRVGS
jgi:hypothetical protein